jgi:hypothetical protein
MLQGKTMFELAVENLRKLNHERWEMHQRSMESERIEEAQEPEIA